jgi:hypothetical protein
VAADGSQFNQNAELTAGRTAGRSETIRSLLEEQIVPVFYERDSRGIPLRWMRIVKQAIRTVAPHFCAPDGQTICRTDVYPARVQRAQRFGKLRYD